ncbi:hypothetical protein ACVWWJ_003327 [Luteibacter sp. HA06]
MNAIADNAIAAATAWVLAATTDCYQCQSKTKVFTILLSGPFALRGEPNLVVAAVDDAVLTLTTAAPLPREVLTVIGKLSQDRYRLDHSQTAGCSYWMNHCEACDAKLGDYYLERPGEAFFPMDDEGFAQLQATCIRGPLEFGEPSCGYNGALAHWIATLGEGPFDDANASRDVAREQS